MGSNDPKSFLSGVAAFIAFALHIFGIQMDELATIKAHHSVLGNISARCGWQRVYSFADDLEQKYDAYYANQQAQAAGHLWYTFNMIAILIALAGLVANSISENHGLWSKLYVTAAFVLFMAAACTFYGGSGNICHQQDTELGISPIIAMVAAFFYFVAGLVQCWGDHDYVKMIGSKMLGINLLIRRISGSIRSNDAFLLEQESISR